MLAYSLFVASVGFQATASGWALAPGVCPARISSLTPFPRLDATADGEEELSQNLSLFDSDFFAPRFSTEVVASGQKLLYTEEFGSDWQWWVTNLHGGGTEQRVRQLAHTPIISLEATRFGADGGMNFAGLRTRWH